MEAEPYAKEMCLDVLPLDMEVPRRPEHGGGWGRRALRAAAGVAACLLCEAPSLSGVRRPARRRGPLWAAPGEAVGLQVGRGANPETPTEDAVICAVEMTTIVWRTSAAVVAIRGAVLDCVDLTTDNQRAVCSIRVSSAISNAFNVIVAAASMASVCPGVTNKEAACTAAVSRVVASLSLIAQTIAETTQNCHLWWHSVPVPPNGRTTTMRTTTKCPHVTLPRLPRITASSLAAILDRKNKSLPTIVPMSLIDNMNKEDYRWNMVSCWQFSLAATEFMFRIGLVLQHALRTCNSDDPHGPETCALDIFALIGSVAQAARYLSLSIVNCAGEPVLAGSAGAEAACAGAISGVVGGTTRGISSFIAFGTVCQPEKSPRRRWF